MTPNNKINTNVKKRSRFKCVPSVHICSAITFHVLNSLVDNSSKCRAFLYWSFYVWFPWTCIDARWHDAVDFLRNFTEASQLMFVGIVNTSYNMVTVTFQIMAERINSTALGGLNKTKVQAKCINAFIKFN